MFSRAIIVLQFGLLLKKKFINNKLLMKNIFSFVSQTMLFVICILIGSSGEWLKIIQCVSAIVQKVNIRI